ncbi:ankyrin repeat domain-containing protein [Aspergillus undulatus]|uniref:ankyrin repeat domain-containing protein n=1 Tax=Aspergillus undulatus TaxID=1810928 RepID=UPI003CCD29F8
MDPVTVLGLLASISTLLKAGKGAVDLLRSFKDAVRDLTELATNLERFNESVGGFDRVFRSRQARHSISEDVLRKVIDDGRATLAEFEKRLNQVYKSESSTLRRARFLQYRSRFEAINAKIHTQSSQIHGFITLMHAFVKPSAFTLFITLGDVPDACAAVAEEAEGKYLSPGDALPLNDLKRSRSRNSSSSGAISIGGSTLVAESLSSRKGSVSSFSPRNSAVTLVDDPGELSSQVKDINLGSRASRVDDRDRLIIRRACRHDCYCKCHEEPQSGESKRGFSRFGARVFHKSNPPQAECSDPNCAGAQQNKAIPMSSFKRAMSQLMSSNNVKIHYRLNTYRMVPEGWNAMRYVKNGNLGKLKMAIQSGEATPWDTAPDGWTLLHYLVELGAEPTSSDFAARKPVDLAFLKSIGTDATQVEKDIVQLFSKEDDCTDDYEFTPIHIAVLELYDPSDAERPTLEQLIDFVDNANNAAPDTNWARWKSKYQRRSPLYVSIIEQFRASAAENPNTSKVIHNLTDQKDRIFHWTPLHWASASGQRHKMKILVENGADPFIQSNLNFSIIHSAVESNAQATLSYALGIASRHPDRLSVDQVNVWGETALMMAAQGCRVGCVELLLGAGADRNIRQENQQVALHYAGLSDRAELRRQTVELICGGNTDTDAELDIDACDEDGRPPIFDFLDDEECILILHRHGARLDLSDNSGSTVFHHACIQGELKSLETLVELSGNEKDILARKNDAGNTALIEALRHDNIECALALLAREDIRVRDVFGQDGWAPIHYTAKLGNVTLLRAVIKHSTFVRGMRTEDGKTARVVAMESGKWHGEIKELLNTYNSVI